MGLKGLKNNQLRDIKKCLQLVRDANMPLDYQIAHQLQDIFKLQSDISSDQFTVTMYVKIKDQTLASYLS